MSGVLKTVGVVAGIAAMFLPPPLSAIALGIATPAGDTQLIEKRKPMTAINAFTIDDVAYMATDTMHLFPDGTIEGFGSKAAILHELGAIVAVAGRGGILAFMEALNGVGIILDQGDLLKAMPVALKSLRERIDKEYPTGIPNQGNRLQGFVALYDVKRGEPLVYVLDTEGDMPSGGKPYEVREVDGILMPGPIGRDVLPFGYVDDPVADTRAVIEAQRRMEFATIPGVCCVGGAVELFSMGPNGWGVETIARYPADEVGGRADRASVAS